MNGQEAGDAAAFRILRSYPMARAFRSDHEDVNVRRRHDLPEVNVEAVAEGQIAVLLQIRGYVSPIDRSLDFVRSEHHHDVRALCRIGARHHFEPGALGLLPRSAFAQADEDVHAALLQIQGMGVSLASVADDRTSFSSEAV